MPDFEKYEIEKRNLLAGDFMLLTEKATVVVTASATLPRGVVLGRTAQNKYKVCKKGSTDGSQNPVAILVDEIAFEGAGEHDTTVFLTGEFNIDMVAIDPSNTDINDVKNKLHDKSIFLRKLY